MVKSASEIFEVKEEKALEIENRAKAFSSYWKSWTTEPEMSITAISNVEELNSREQKIEGKPMEKRPTINRKVLNTISKVQAKMHTQSINMETKI